MNYTAEIFDRFQLLYEINGLNDHQMHCVLRFERQLDLELLRKAVVDSVEAIPILGTRYIANATPHWASIDSKDLSRAFEVVQTEAKLEEFLVTPVDESLGPQIRICALDASPFAVALKMNHMVCDAAGFKAYLYYLCELYSNRDCHPLPRGDRGMGVLLRRLGFAVKLKCLLFQEDNLTCNAKFPLPDEGDARAFIATRKLNRERTAAMKDRGKQIGATLNDVAVTALYRCLFRWLNLRPGAECQFPVMVDLRRYLGSGAQSLPLTNLSSMVSTKLTFKLNEEFDGTLARVKAELDARKKNNPGLSGVLRLAELFRIFGHSKANRLLRAKLNYPYICMTNVGVLDSERLLFGEQRPIDAYMCGSIKYKPYFQLAMSSYDGEITWSVNLSGNAGDRERVESFLAEIDAELR